MKNTRNTIMFFVFLLGAVVVGGLISYLTQDIPFLSWLSYGQDFGLGNETPLNLDLGILQLTFGVGLNLNIAVIICITLSMIMYGRFYGRR